MNRLLVSPSILSADFLNLERDIRRLEQANADHLHIDIMDGVFVTNTTWGPSTVAAIRNVTSLPLEVHLMIDKPERLIDEYLRAGSDILIVHPESTVFLRKILLHIKRQGVKAGVAIKLETPVETIIHCLELVDVVLLLTCDEGFGGNPFQPLAIKKIIRLDRLRKDDNLEFKIEVDGGINIETGRLSKGAGANILVAGSYIFNQEMSTAINLLRNV